MVPQSQILFADTERQQPVPAEASPVLEPLHIRSGLAEEFHLHLLELQRAEDEVSGSDLVTEALAYLADAERNFAAAGPEDALIIDEYALCRLGAEV